MTMKANKKIMGERDRFLLDKLIQRNEVLNPILTSKGMQLFF